MQNQFNSNDRELWNNIFQSPNPAWRLAPEQVFMKDAREFFQAAGARTVLDIGCGVGIWSIYLARHGFEVTGTDFSENAVKVCRNWADDEKLNISFHAAPITFDPVPDQMFDAVVAALIFDNVAREEMAQAIALLATKLKPDGVLFALFNPFLTAEQKEAILKASNNPTKDITSVAYTDDELKSAFPGFKMMEFKKYPMQGFEFRGISLQKS